MRGAMLAALALAALVLGGCATGGARLPEAQAALVARDFASALARLRGFDPRGTTLQLRTQPSAFGARLEEELRRAGFGLQSVPEDGTGPLLVTFDAERFVEEAGESVGYRVRVGGIELAREYEVRGARVFPLTALSVRGVEIDAAPLDGTIFERQVIERQSPEARATSAARPERPMPPADTADGWYAPASEAPHRAAPPAVKRNVLELGESNFAALFEGLETAEREVLVFGDDSLRLGRENKARLARMAERFDPETDVMSVIGCSHGRSALPNGNELLATGRANRVKEELIMLGLEASAVLEEGCWAPSDQAGLPPRGVIVSRRTREAPS